MTHHPLAFWEALGTELEKKLQTFCDVRLLAMKLGAGKVNDCPFPRAAVEEGRQLVFVALEMAGAKLDGHGRPISHFIWRPLKNS